MEVYSLVKVTAALQIQCKVALRALDLNLHAINFIARILYVWSHIFVSYGDGYMRYWFHAAVIISW
jgi:predicted signal transduction protein with EAL and GGDEF domain